MDNQLAVAPIAGILAHIAAVRQNPGGLPEAEATGAFKGSAYTMAELANLERWFSPERMARYVEACPDHPDRAAALYSWNSVLAAAFWRTLGHVEVLMRNALNDRLMDRSYTAAGGPQWYMTLAPVLDWRTRVDIAEARRRATRAGRAETVGRVVAELNFGFWRYLVAARYDRSLWRTALFRAFPGKARHDVERRFATLHVFRNRIAHHEPIHHLDLADIRADALALASWVDADAARWIAHGDDVRLLLPDRP